MRDAEVKSTTVYALLVISLAFAGGDLWLLNRLRQQETLVLDLQYEKHLSSVAPMVGQPVPVVQGISLKTNRPLAVDLNASPRQILLVFSQGCDFCENNWKNWDKLFPSAAQATRVYLISSDQSLPSKYIDQHPLLSRFTVLLGVDALVLQALHVGSMPQTIYVADGKVQHDWAGVLKKQDVGEIAQLISNKKAE